MDGPGIQLQDRNKKMEDEFNRKHGARRTIFAEGEAVYVRCYEDPNHPTWQPGQILKKRGQTVYDVQVDRKVMCRHANQLRPRETEEALKVLCDSFDLTDVTGNKDVQDATEDITQELVEDAQAADVINTPVGPSRPRRMCRPPKRLDMDSSKKKYGFCWEGEVLWEDSYLLYFVFFGFRP